MLTYSRCEGGDSFGLFLANDVQSAEEIAGQDEAEALDDDRKDLFDAHLVLVGGGRVDAVGEVGTGKIGEERMLHAGSVQTDGVGAH